MLSSSLFCVFVSTGLALTLHFLSSFPPFPPPSILDFFNRPLTKPSRKNVISCHLSISILCTSFLLTVGLDICRWFLVTLKYLTVFPLWQMDLRLLVPNQCRFTIHNFTGFVLYITGLNILSQNSSAWHFQLIRGPCQFF